MAGGLDEALALAQADPLVAEVFVIGGAGVYREAFEKRCCQRVYLTRVLADVECDVFIPDLDADKAYTLTTEHPEVCVD